MRKSIAAAVLIALCTTTSACARHHDESPGPVVSRNYKVGAFDKIEAAGPFDVTIRTGAAPSVQARGNQALLDRLEVDVSGGELRIRPRNDHGWFSWGGTHGHADINITVPELHGATLAGAGGINIDKVQGDRFEGQIAGSGDMKIDAVQLASLKLGVAGAGSAVVRSGTAQSAEFKIAGSGDVDTSTVNMQDLKVSIAGAGNVKAHATRTANVDIMGSGDVGITGGAKCKVTKAGAGDVRCS